MKGFPVTFRTAAVIGAMLVAGLLAGPAAADTARERALRDASEPGAFCTPSSCRPRSASGWTAAAFGGVVVAMGWRARRDDDAS